MNWQSTWQSNEPSYNKREHHSRSFPASKSFPFRRVFLSFFPFPVVTSLSHLTLLPTFSFFSRFPRLRVPGLKSGRFATAIGNNDITFLSIHNLSTYKRRVWGGGAHGRESVSPTREAKEIYKGLVLRTNNDKCKLAMSMITSLWPSSFAEHRVPR